MNNKGGVGELCLCGGWKMSEEEEKKEREIDNKIYENISKDVHVLELMLYNIDLSSYDREKVDILMTQIINKIESENEANRLPDKERRTRKKKMVEMFTKGKNPFRACIHDGCSMDAKFYEESNPRNLFCSKEHQYAYYEFIDM